jgi:trehalose/maltose transport system permease protein
VDLRLKDGEWASVVVTVPLLLLVFLFQRRIVEGLTAGAIKG